MEGTDVLLCSAAQNTEAAGQSGILESAKRVLEDPSPIAAYAQSLRTSVMPFCDWMVVSSTDFLLRDTAAQNTEAAGHSGILESAKGVLEDLQSTGVLEQLMLHPPVSHRP